MPKTTKKTKKTRHDPIAPSRPWRFGDLISLEISDTQNRIAFYQPYPGKWALVLTPNGKRRWMSLLKVDRQSCEWPDRGNWGVKGLARAITYRSPTGAVKRHYWRYPPRVWAHEKGSLAFYPVLVLNREIKG